MKVDSPVTENWGLRDLLSRRSLSNLLLSAFLHRGLNLLWIRKPLTNTSF